MIPPLAAHGLLPPGEHCCSLVEAEQCFATSAHRKQLWNNLLLALKTMRDKGLSGSLVVDGSYVTDKPLPDDIEVSLDARGQPDTIQGLAVIFHLSPQAQTLREQHKVSFHATIDGAHDFTLFFQYLGPKSAKIKGLNRRHPKGVLRIFEW